MGELFTYLSFTEENVTIYRNLYTRHNMRKFIFDGN